MSSLTVCETFKAKGIAPITLGMKDGWPLDSCAVSGIVGANETDLTGLCKRFMDRNKKIQ